MDFLAGICSWEAFVRCDPCRALRDGVVFVRDVRVQTAPLEEHPHSNAHTGAQAINLKMSFHAMTHYDRLPSCKLVTPGR